MLLSILDHNLERVGFLDNEDNAKGLVFYNDMWSRYLETGSATFDFTVDKKNLELNTHNRRVYQTLNERSFVSFHDNGRAYLFNIMKTVEDEDAITCYCENLNLELLNEYANPFKADKAYSFEEYCKKLDLLDFAALKLGINEVSDQKRTIEWTGQDTKLKRLISLANNFDAEIAFETYLNDDSSLKVFRLNVFKEHDDKHQGVGVRRDDIILNYDQNIEKITRTVDKTPIFNMIHPTGSDKTITRQVTKTRTVYKTVTVSGGGAGNTENALRNIESRKGQRVGTGQCYSLSALYSALLGGPGLGAGVTGISGRIGAGIAASNIGTDYRWGAFGWAVVGNEVSNAKAGAIVNIRANYGSPFWTGPYGHTAIIKSVSGSTITVLEQNYAGRMYIVENSYNLGAYMAGVQTLCYPPELAAGKVVGGQAVTKQVPVQETYTENVKETVKTVIPSNKYKEYKNDTGEVEFYVKDGSIYAPISAKLYPSVLSGKEIGDNWIRKDASIETTDENVLEANALKMLRAGCYPTITYDVKGDADLEPGDTVKVHDDQFYPVLLLEMRASEVHRSFSDPDQGHSVFTNFKVLENQLPSDLLSRMEELADAKAPYTIRLSSDNGTSFKNNEGETLFKADLYKGEKLLATDVSWRWALDGVVTVGMQYLVKAKDIDETAVITVAGYVGNTEVATTEITLTNINDGPQGPKGPQGIQGLQGPKGEQGIAGKDGSSIYNSKYTGIRPNLSNMYITDLTPSVTIANLVIGSKVISPSGDVFEVTSKNPNSTPPSFGVGALLTNIKGKDGLSQYTHIAYADNDRGGGFSQTDQSKRYIGMYQDYTATDSSDPARYHWSKWKGDDGVQGVPGKPGTDGRTPYIHFAYANSADGKTNFSTTYFSGALYVGTLTDYNSADSTTYSAYTWSRLKGDKGDKGDKGETGPRGPQGIQGLQGPKGDQGIQGPKGADGKTQYTHIAYANDATGGGFSQTDQTKAYIGMYVDFNATDSNDPTKYRWSKWHGDKGATGAQGIQGPKGADGRTPYIHFAYANSADGKTNFSTTYFSGALYVGTLTDYNSADSTTYSAYTWSRLKGDKGDKGDKGETGPRGPQGIQGLQGPKGDQGIQGPKGADGKTQYTHIAYANDATGGGFSQTDQTKAYIGMYVDFNATDSNDPTKYRWSKWHGDKGATGAQGIQGPKGADGRTPYLHIAYANSADGRTDFSTSNSGNKRYLGTYTDYTQADSTDPSKYKWVDMVGTVKVGGRNLAQKTSKDWSKPFTGFSGIQNTCPNLYKVITDGLVVGDTLKTRIVLKYTDIKPVSGKTAEIWIQGAGNVTAWNSGAYPSGGGGRRSLSGSGEAVFELTDKINADHLKNDYWSWAFRTDWIASGSLEWKEAKVEAGTVFSKWSPALEDTQEQIDSKADQALTQEQLNALAEKNNLIKAEMEAKASIDTVDKWITAYENYVKANDADKAKSEQALKEASERILGMRYEVNDLKFAWDAIDRFMSFQNEGLIIGKKDGSAYAKFSDDRISLFSGSSEVMYISQGTLNIANGIFTKTIQIGRFRFETHPADADMLVLRYLGG